MRDYKPGDQLVVSNMQTDFVELFNIANLLTHDNIPALSTGQFVHKWTVTANGAWYTSNFTAFAEPLSATSQQYFASINFHDPSNTVDDTYLDSIIRDIAQLQTRTGQ